MLNDREIATAVIIAAAIIGVLLNGSTRRTVPPVIKAAFRWRLTHLWVTYVVYSVAVVWAASRLHAWDWTITQDTFLFVLGTGLPLLFSASKLSDGPRFLRSTVRRTIGVSAFIGLYVNLEAFPLWAEIPLQMVAIAAGVLEAVAERMPNSDPARRLFRAITILIGVAFLWRTTVALVGWSTADWIATGRVAGMSVWFVVALLPFVYCVAYWMRCGQILSYLRVQNPGNRRPPRRVRLAVLVGLRGSVRLAHRFAGRWFGRVGRMPGYHEAQAAMTEFRASLIDEASPAPGRRRRRGDDAVETTRVPAS